MNKEDQETPSAKLFIFPHAHFANQIYRIKREKYVF